MGQVCAPSPRWRRCRLATLAGILALAGCSADTIDTPTATAPIDVTTTAPATPQPTRTVTRKPSPPPRSGACYRLSVARAQRPTNGSDPAPCSQPHSAQTYYVGVMPKAVVGSAHTLDTAAIADYVTPRCDSHFVAHVGGSRNMRVLSRLQPVWFVPTRTQFTRGARWFRCDVIGFAAAEALARLPQHSAGVLERRGSLETYGLCSTAAPSRASDHQVMCGRPHTWRALSVIRLGDRGSRWRGKARLSAARQDCKAQVRAHQGYPVRWTYGWQPPTRAQWQDGRRWGYCWSPERR